MTTLSLPFSTERLLSRPFTPDDLDDLYAYQGIPEVARYLYRPPLTREQCAQSLTRRAAGTAWAEDGDDLVVAVCPADGAKVVGEVVLKLTSARARQVEIGWNFNPAYGGRGYAIEAARATAAPAFAAHTAPSSCSRPSRNSRAPSSSPWFNYLARRFQDASTP
ncbi:GNAT family N-acetyltransferase [Streptomyces sp. NPDC000927]|uniref:GNAT family N-acetyltransferase n=1 Tax=unclassified Streptomyces TaxID=2593676 RepID=UPI003317DCB1